MRKSVSVVLITCGLLLGCGKTETASTDTAVTETIAPEPPAAGTEAAEASTDSSPEDQKEADPGQPQGRESGNN